LYPYAFRFDLTDFSKPVIVKDMKTAVEIYKLLPKTNCGKCGTPNCFGFAVKLSTGQATLDQCGTMTESARSVLSETMDMKRESAGTVFEQTLAVLQPKIKALDFRQTAGLFGVNLKGPDELNLTFLNQPYRINREKVVDSAGSEPPAWIAILIYNHLCMPDPPPPAGEWITFSSIPASHAKDKAWAGHVEEVIAKHFAGNVDALRKACADMGGSPAEIPGNQDAAFTFRFFPHYPALLLFYDAVPDEGFPAQCKLLLDKTAPQYLDIESIVVLGEEFAGRLTGGAGGE
jgi:hypothetical protein